MNVIHSIGLENIVYFKEPTTFEFTKGLTFIQGRNLQRRGPAASNGSGKSLLFGVLPNLLFDSHPTITKNTRSVQRQLYVKGSRASVKFTRGKHQYEYEKSGAKTRLSRDGKDLQSRIAREQLRKLVDLSEEEFFSTVYLDSRRNNQFQLGTSADRFAFITQLFRLQNIDDFRKHVNKNIAELNSDGRLLEQTLLDLADVAGKLKVLPKVTQQQTDELAQWLQRSSTRTQRLAAEQHNWTNWQRYKKVLDDLEQLTVPEKSVKQLGVQIDAHVAYRASVKATQQVQAKTNKWKTELLGLSQVDAELLPVQQERANKLGTVSVPAKPQGDISAARLAAQKVSLSKARRIARNSESSVRVLGQQLAEFNAEIGEQDVCPTCHSTLTKATRRAVRQRFEESLAQASDKLRRATKFTNAYEIVEAHDAYDMQIKSYTVWKKAKAEIDAYPFEQARRKLELQKLLKASSVELDTLPNKPQGNIDLLKEQLAQARKYSEITRLAESLRVEKPVNKVDPAAIKVLNDEVSAKMSLLPDLQATLAERRSLRKQTSELAARENEITGRVQDLPVYKLLQDAYSTSGIKTLMVKRIAVALEKNLNKYSRQIFAEDFTFRFEVQDNKFDVWVTRRTGRKEITSDIRHMSGAESRLFVFLFVLSLLPLIPASRRMNILVMDEPDSNMDADTLETFSTRLLPALQKIVPSVIVITPRNDYIPSGSKIFTVVKDKGHSRLVVGKV